MSAALVVWYETIYSNKYAKPNLELIFHFLYIYIYIYIYIIIYIYINIYKSAVKRPCVSIVLSYAMLTSSNKSETAVHCCYA